MNEFSKVLATRFRGMLIVVLPFLFLLTLFAPPNASASSLRVGSKSPQFEMQGFNSEKLIGEKNILFVFYRGHF
jgi:hypothetical protein